MEHEHTHVSAGVARGERLAMRPHAEHGVRGARVVLGDDGHAHAVEVRVRRSLHVLLRCVYTWPMERLNITLDDEPAEKLARLAERMHVQPGTVARSLLSSALDDADPDARHVVELLDGIPGAYERAQLGLTQAKTGETVSLDDL